ncbi:ribonuclease PH [Puniceicoccus vermicola]|uniref:Ribonuclease PH n=1 Tax=Puniceicoccus vermicola TaxID=388746 RepID=A0A7X1B2F3_9BACT|nr:ribonuclease PH [Puniceicoccus vermicola]MBC2604388.1 ribonuclease PH [Puniceicoccus vermicola]
MTDLPRPDGRQNDELRPVTFEPGIAPNATGSVLVSFGNTRVICAATIEKKVPRWMNAQGVKGGWVSAEYSMLPYSTHDRKQRDVNRGKQDGRGIEIQRLIGRSLRAVIDLQKLPGHTLWVDCDVLQADGGTRTASITGAYVAAEMAVRRLMKDGVLTENPFKDSIAAVSVGVFYDTSVLDLNYPEDLAASVDFNVVMTGSGQFVELQGTGEEATFSDDQLTQLLGLAKKGIGELTELQKAAL